MASTFEDDFKSAGAGVVVGTLDVPKDALLRLLPTEFEKDLSDKLAKLLVVRLVVFECAAEIHEDDEREGVGPG
jgi:hypothetical protein